MHKFLILIIFLLLYIENINCQNEKLFSFGIESNAKITTQSFKKPKIVNSKSSFNFGLAFNLFYSINSKLEMKTSISASKNTINHYDNSLVFSCDLDPNTGGSGNDSGVRSYLKESYRTLHIGIPVDFKYKIYEKTNHLYCKIGTELLFKLNQNQINYLSECGSVEREIDNMPNNRPLNNILLTGRVGIGYEFEFLKNSKLYIEPQFAISGTNLFEENNDINMAKLIDSGLVIGVKF